MKNKLLYALALATSMVACTDDYTDWAAPLHSDPEEAMTVSLSATASSDIDIASLADDSVTVFTASVTAPEGSSVTAYTLKLNDNQALPVSMEGKASVDDLNKAVIALCGKEMVAQTLNASLDAYVKVKGTSIKTNASFQLKVTPFVAPEYFVVGAIQGWSNSDQSCMFYPQSDYVHSYTTLWAGSYDLKIWQGADFGDWNLAYGCALDGDNSVTGTLVQNNAQSISAPTAEYYTLTIDMENLSYSWTKLENQTPAEYGVISLIGEFNGWDEGGSEVALRQVSAHNWYVENVALAGETKLRADNSWSINWGAGVNIGDKSYATCSINGSNINVPAGNYSVYFNDITGDIVFRTVE